MKNEKVFENLGIVTNIEKKINELKNLKEKLINSKKHDDSSINEYENLANKKVWITIGDLVSGIEKETGISSRNTKLYLKTNLCAWGKKTKEEMLDFIKSEKNIPTLNLKLIGYKDKIKESFRYNIYTPINFNQKQADGKSILEHMTVTTEYDKIHDSWITKMDINKNIKDVVLNLKLEDLTKAGKMFYPEKHFVKAINNSKFYKKNK